MRNARELLWCWTAKYPNIMNFYKELHRDVHYHPIYSRYINDKIVAVEAAKQGVAMGEDTVSGLMFEDDFVGITVIPEVVR